MAIVSNPLLSLQAHGKFAEEFVFTQRMACHQVKRMSRPTGPASPAQTSARARMSAVSENWKNIFSSEAGSRAWQLYAREKGRTLTAANCFIRAALSLTPENTAPGFILAAYGVGRVLVLKLLDAFSTEISIEPGAFLIARGESQNTMIFKAGKTIDSGSLIGPVAPAGGNWWYQVYKDSVSRSGIISLTQTQAATYNQAEAAGVTYAQLLNAGITWDDLI